jgi:hypothetical protein
MNFRRTNLNGTSQTRNSARTARRLQAAGAQPIEMLESRTMFTAVFNSDFGAETLKGDGGQRLTHPEVVLVFWGKYWGSASSANATSVYNAVKKELSTDFLSVTKQYGTSGSATLSPSVGYISSNPTNRGFDGGDIDNVVNQAISKGQVPSLLTNQAIYEVITPPGIASSSSGASGFNDEKSNTVETWISSGGKSGLSIDNVTLVLSHETAESMTDPGGNGIEFNPSSSDPVGGSGNQIGDYEGNAYTFRESNGILVQPLWSADDNSWAVGDGNKQKFYIDPVWHGSKFTGTYGLTLQGGQLDGGYNPNTYNLSIGVDKATGSADEKATLNGESEYFDQGKLSNLIINFDFRGTPDVANIDSVVASSPVYINAYNSGVANIGQGTTQTIFSSVTINDVQATFIDDSKDSRTGLSGTITKTSVTGFGLPGGVAINYNQYNRAGTSLSVYGGPGANTDLVTGTSATYGVNLYPGTDGASTVSVRGTTAPLTIYGGGQNDTFFIGSLAPSFGTGGTLSNIDGSINIQETGLLSTLGLDDSGDSKSRTAVLEADYFGGTGLGNINFWGTELADVTVFGGKMSNVLKVSGNLPYKDYIYNFTIKKS